MKLKVPINHNPIFIKGTDYYYQKSGKARNNLLKSLLIASENYCMYTYEPITAGTGEFIGDIEHSIEKSEHNGVGINPFNCKFNLSVSTRILNIKYKKNMLPTGDNYTFKCDKKYSCDSACDEMKKMHVKSMKLNEFLLMPNLYSSYISRDICDLEYSIFNLQFHPSENKRKTVFSQLLQKHIDRFKLNDNNYISSEIINLCEVILDIGKLPLLMQTKTSNYIVWMFIDFINNFDENKQLSIARLIVNNSKITLPEKNTLTNKDVIVVHKKMKRTHFVSDDCFYLTPEDYGVAKRRFNDKVVIKKYIGVEYPFLGR